jgi:hypothetical protein
VEIERSLEESKVRLAELEATMPGEDSLDWVRKAILPLAKACAIETSRTLEQPQAVTEVMPEPPPGFFYMRCRLEGAGSFHQVGAFLAALENALPTVQVEEFEVGVFSARKGGDPAQLGFEAQISFLAPRGAGVSR